jgi:hypothetical protein
MGTTKYPPNPPKDSRKAFSQLILDDFPYAQLSVLAPSRVGSSDDNHGGSASADLYVENIQIGRLANVHFGEYI